MAGIATKAPTGIVATPARTRATSQGRPQPCREVGEAGRAHGGERHVTEGDLSGGAHEEPQRSEHEDVDECGGEDRELRADQARAGHHQHSDPDHTNPTKCRALRTDLSLVPAGDRAELDQAAGAGEQEDDEQHDEGQAGRDAAQQGDVGGVPRRDRGADTEDQTTDEGQRQAGEPADRGRAERLDRQERQQHRIQTDRGSEQHPGQERERRADGPGSAPDGIRAGAGEIEEARVIDHATHRRADPAPSEVLTQRDARQQGEDEDQELVVADVDASEGEGARREERLHVADRGAVPRRQQPLDGGQQPDGGNDLRGDRGAGEPVGQALEGEPDERPDDQDDDDRGHRPRRAPLIAYLVEEVGAQGGEGAVGEVEDARGLVGEDEAGGGQPVDGTADESSDDERQEVMHRRRSERGPLRRACRRHTVGGRASRGCSRSRS